MFHLPHLLASGIPYTFPFCGSTCNEIEHLSLPVENANELEDIWVIQRLEQLHLEAGRQTDGWDGQMDRQTDREKNKHMTTGKYSQVSLLILARTSGRRMATRAWSHSRGFWTSSHDFTSTPPTSTPQQPSVPLGET